MDCFLLTSLLTPISHPPTLSTLKHINVDLANHHYNEYLYKSRGRPNDKRLHRIRGSRCWFLNQLDRLSRRQVAQNGFRFLTFNHLCYRDYPKKRGSKPWCKGVSSNMDLIGRLRVMQSDVHSHIMVELSAVK